MYNLLRHLASCDLLVVLLWPSLNTNMKAHKCAIQRIELVSKVLAVIIQLFELIHVLIH